MRQIGIRLQVDYVTWARFLEMVDAKQAQFFALGWQADYPDEQTFFQLLYSKNQSPGPELGELQQPAVRRAVREDAGDGGRRRARRAVPRDGSDRAGGLPVDPQLLADHLHALLRLGARPSPPNTTRTGRWRTRKLDVELRQRRLFGGEKADVATAGKPPIDEETETAVWAYIVRTNPPDDPDRARRRADHDGAVLVRLATTRPARGPDASPAKRSSTRSAPRWGSTSRAGSNGRSRFARRTSSAGP